MNYNPLFLIDFYKATHAMMYPKDLTFLVSYYTPRMSRLADVDKLTMFGLQGFIKEYLIDGFNKYFFNRPEEEVIEEYKYYLDNCLGAKAYNLDNIRNLHRLGYLPLLIRAVPEGMRTAIGVPQVEIVNTHKEFAWLVNTIETMLSDTLWHTQISAEVGHRYRKIVDKYWEKTCNSNVPAHKLLSDFSMRGQQSVESAIKSSAGWLLSFTNSATLPANLYLEKYYNADCSLHNVGMGTVSTEHSVMCSNYAVDGDEISLIKRLITEIYPDSPFCMVCDSYDYERFVNEIVPACKEEILAHTGWIGIRGDSGDPVSVVTWTVERLWENFGGYYNSKGYKVLTPQIKAVYGDSITPQRCEAIYNILVEKGFSIENVSLGVGSFSFMCLEEYESGNVNYKPYTRDTFGIAVKATYGELNDGTQLMIHKEPKALSWKKSQKGCCIVSEDGLSYTDGHNWAATYSNNLLKEVFFNGKIVKEYKLEEVRNNLYKSRKQEEENAN